MPGTRSRIARIKAKLDAYDSKFNAIPEKPDDEEWIKAKLHHMFRRDQFLLKSLPKKGDPGLLTGSKKEIFDGIGVLAGRVNKQNVSDLKLILAKITWPAISQFGAQADNEAWLIVQHADLNFSFQKETLATLEKLYPHGETSLANYAYLYDRVATNEANEGGPQLQRYGTQGYVLNNRFCLRPVEDPEGLDTRRNAMGLGPVAEYISQCERVYGLNGTRSSGLSPG